jgi:hypothetical protein
MTGNVKTGLDSEVYYHKPIEFLKKCKKENRELTHDELSIFIIKSLNIKCSRRVIRRLKELGYIAHEKKKLIKILK